MAISPLQRIVDHMRLVARRQAANAVPDKDLLDSFLHTRDEAAFEALVRRHGPMVLGVCERILQNRHDAEDAFQATFLVLLRKATSIGKRDRLVSWLYGVAQRTALRVLSRAAKRRIKEKAMSAKPPASDGAVHELLPLLDQELARLPDKYRTPILLCDLEGKTRKEAAQLLGLPAATLSTRLDRGRALLAKRFTRHGYTLSGGALAVALSQNLAAAMPHGLVASTVKAGSALAVGKAAGIVSASVIALSEEVVKAMLLTKLKGLTAVLVLGAVACGGGTLAYQTATAHEVEEKPALTSLTQAPRAVQQAEEAKPRTDAAGDPLPEGAIARIGTLRYRHPDNVNYLAFLPAGQTILTRGGDGVRLWETNTGKEINHFPKMAGHDGIACDLSPDGKTFASIDGESRKLVLWDLAAGQRVRDLGNVRSMVRFSPDGKLLITNSEGTKVKLCDTQAGTTIREWQPHEQSWFNAAFSSDSKTLVTSGNSEIRFWEVATGAKIREFSTDKPAGRIALSPAGKLLASHGTQFEIKGNFGISWPDNFIRIWDVQTGKEIHQLVGSENANLKDPDSRYRRGFTEFLFSPDGKTLATCGGSSLQIWDPAAGKEVRRIDLDCLSSWGLAFSGDGKTIATSASARTIRLFDAKTGQDLAPSGESFLGTILLSPDGKNLACIGHKAIHIWEPRTGKLKRSLENPLGSASDLGLASDGRTLFAEGRPWGVAAWDLESGKRVGGFAIDASTQGMGLAISPDGKSIVLFKDKSALLVDTATGRELREFKGHDMGVVYSAFVAGGKTLVTCSIDHKWRLWDVASGQKTAQFPFPRNYEPPQPGLAGDYLPSYLIALSPDQRVIAYGSQHKFLALMELATGREIACFQNLPDGLCPMAFAPDGRTLAWGGWQTFPIRFTEILSGKERRQFLGHKGRVVSLAYSGDGKMLVSQSSDTTALVWDLTYGELKKPLSPQEISACWDDLAGDDAARAYKAIRMLAGDPARTAPFLADRLRPIPVVEDKTIAGLITNLGNDAFAVRENAAKDLEQLGDIADPACRAAAKEPVSLEVRRRLEALIQKNQQRSQNPAPEFLRTMRAQECLEMMGTPDARKVLARISQGATQARLTQDAKAAAERMEKAKK